MSGSIGMGETIKPPRYAVLVVEDDPLLLMDALDLVEEAGLLAYGARNATEAIVMMEQHEDIRVLFTDVQMPGSMDGIQLSAAVHSRWPDTEVMVTSGRIQPRAHDLPPNVRFLAKPYPAYKLTDAALRLIH